mmetsp:Transcript_20480/g.47889  ORF Transcript_20480/g.47889 Transcript_20480/m.47889 type:complete len:255 (-) Transcript_20480:624-1388(-)
MSLRGAVVSMMTPHQYPGTKSLQRKFLAATIEAQVYPEAAKSPCTPNHRPHSLCCPIAAPTARRAPVLVHMAKPLLPHCWRPGRQDRPSLTQRPHPVAAAVSMASTAAVAGQGTPALAATAATAIAVPSKTSPTPLIPETDAAPVAATAVDAGAPALLPSVVRQHAAPSRRSTAGRTGPPAVHTSGRVVHSAAGTALEAAVAEVPVSLALEGVRWLSAVPVGGRVEIAAANRVLVGRRLLVFAVGAGAAASAAA